MHAASETGDVSSAEVPSAAGHKRRQGVVWGQQLSEDDGGPRRRGVGLAAGIRRAALHLAPRHAEGLRQRRQPRIRYAPAALPA